jgi:hypothetical protein
MIKRTTTFNEKTGEVINTKQQSFTDSLNEDGYRMPSHKLGARIFNDVQFPAEMSYGDIGKMTCLAKMMIAKNNMLGYRSKGRIAPYNMEEIGGLVGMSGKRAKEFVWKMINSGVMCREDAKDETRYFINPAYFMANGQRLSFDMFIRFQKELIPLLPGWVIEEFLRQAKEDVSINKLHSDFKNAINQMNQNH